MRVNINLHPRNDRAYDLHLPIPLIVTPSQDPTINASEKQILETFKDISKDTPLVICENGGPPAWSERVAKVLIKHKYADVSVDTDFDYEYFNTPSKMFPDPKRPYTCVRFDTITKKIKDFFEFYKTQTWEIEEPVTGVTGHYYRGRMLWTQIQKHSDISSSKNYKLMSRLAELLPDATSLIEILLKQNDINLENIDSRITLRLIDYVNGPGINQTLGSHIDASLITGILYHDNPGLHVRNYLDDSLSLDASEVEDVSDWVENGISVFFPGHLLCDELRSWAPACWHGVQVPDNVDRRLSLVVRVESLDL